MNLKKNKIDKIISNSENITTREELTNNLKKQKRDLKKYFDIYQKMENIINNFKGNQKFLDELDVRIKEKLELLNKIEFKEIYHDIFATSVDGDEENDNYEENENNENKEDMVQLQTQEIMNRQEYYKEREKDLQKVHKTAAQLKDLTQNMAQQINKQGEILDNIELNVEKAQQNSKEAREEIKKANEAAKKNRKKLCCLIFIIFVSLAAIASIILSLIL